MPYRKDIIGKHGLLSLKSTTENDFFEGVKDVIASSLISFEDSFLKASAGF